MNDPQQARREEVGGRVRFRLHFRPGWVWHSPAVGRTAGAVGGSVGGLPKAEVFLEKGLPE